MQTIDLTFTTTRERRTADATLREQLAFIAERALAGRRGKGWDYEVGSIEFQDYGSERPGVYLITASVKMTRKVDLPEDKLQRFKPEILEWAGMSGHNARFGKRPWVLDAGAKKDTGAKKEIEEKPERETILLKDLGEIKPGKFFSHLYGLDAQVRVILSAIQAAIDSNMENRFHSLLYGDPGCGKTSILQSLGNLLESEGVDFELLDATSTTEAGMRKNLLDESRKTPSVIMIEEIEKTPENSLRWLLGIMDDRATIQQANYRRTASRRVPALVLATANDYELLGKMMYGALLSRFSNEVYCPRPNRKIMFKFLEREIRKISNGDVEWIEPTLQFAYDRFKIRDPRTLKRICMSGRERLITGEYQKDLIKTMRLKEGEHV